MALGIYQVWEEFYFPIKQMILLFKYGLWSRGMILAQGLRGLSFRTPDHPKFYKKKIQN